MDTKNTVSKEIETEPNDVDFPKKLTEPDKQSKTPADMFYFF